MLLTPKVHLGVEPFLNHPPVQICQNSRKVMHPGGGRHRMALKVRGGFGIGLKKLGGFRARFFKTS